MNNNNSGIIYLMRDKFHIFTTAGGSVMEFKFVPEIVRDMEIVNNELFLGILQLFIQNNRIQPCQLIIAVSDNSCFIKDFPKHPASQVQPQDNTNTSDKNENSQNKNSDKDISEFLENVPFEDIASTKFENQNSIRVYAANLAICEAIKLAFEKEKFGIDLAIPAGLCGANYGMLQLLNIQTATAMMQASSNLKKYNFYDQSYQEAIKAPVEKLEKEEKKNEFEVIEPETPSSQSGKKDSKRVIMLAAVFGFLIIVLVVVYISSNPSTDTSLSSNAQQPVSSFETVPAQ